MNTKKKTIVIVTFCTLATCVMAVSNEPVSFRLSWQPGETLHYNLDVSANMSAAGERLRMRMSPESTPLVNLHTDRSPIYVALIKNTIVPVCEPYYKFSSLVVEVSDGYYEKVTKASMNDNEGESVEKALFAGSNFAKFLKDMDLSNHFIALLVDSSSFEAFRDVREMLRNRNIPFGWIPCLCPHDFYFNSRGGIQVGELQK